jgi:acyl carrier protein
MSSSNLTTDVRELLAAYVDVLPVDFRMEADLDLAYDMDSTELTELAKKIEQRFQVKATKSHRDAWRSGNDVCRFVEGQLLASSAV